MNKKQIKIILTLVCGGLVSTHGYEPWTPPDLVPDDRVHIEMPPEMFKNVWQNAYSRQVTQTTTRSLDFSRWVRAVVGKPKQALNVNQFDEVRNSSWFEHRNTHKKLSAEEIRRGPRTIPGPDTTEHWTIFKVKSEGMAPGFWIKDSKGNRFIIKPEIKGYPEVGTSAENITTLLFHAAGYHTPENYLTEFNVDKIKIKSGVKFVDDRGVKRAMNQDDLNLILDRTHVRPGGMVRATASRFIKGKPIGSFSFSGIRKGDPNDLIPHEHRRELRGLYVLVSWTNHHDLNSGNFFESYVEDNGKNYIRHYFLDFSSTLGASLFGAQPLVRGYTPLVNPIYIFIVNPIKNWFHVPRWEIDNPIINPSVGRFNNAIFKPNKFKVNYPLAPFSLMTDRDGYWGAKLVMSFTDEQIKSVVMEGFYSDTTAPGILADILIERRDIIGKYWYNQVNPLENFQYNKEKSELCFTDQGVEDGLYEKGKSTYSYMIHLNGSCLDDKGVMETKETCLKIPLPKKNSNKLNQLEISIHTEREGESPGPEINAYLNSRDGQAYQYIGFERE